MASKFRILITTGDSDGIGWEVTAKALNALGPRPGVQFIFYRSAQSFSARPPALTKKFKHRVLPSITEALGSPFDAKTALEVRSPKLPAHWVEEAASACLAGKAQALVTAPLSKTSIAAAGMSEIGHTEILGRVTGKQDLFMGFLGKKFSVVLATGHRPLGRALTELTPVKLAAALHAADRLRSLLSAPQKKLPLALVGVNPHAGEAGLIGKDEIWFRKLAQDLNASLGVEGPLVPDSAFLPQNWGRYSVYVCPYHDQGLIPFKMVHGFTGGVHLTLGLPFVRTSVDHGTAKELFGKNKAQSGSMKDAITAAIRLSKENFL